MTSNPYILFYDAACGLCQSARRLVERFQSSKALFFVDIHDDEAMARYPQVDRRQAEQSVILLHPDGRQDLGYDAITTLAGLLPAGRPIQRLMQTKPVQAMGNRTYDWVSRHRHSFSRKS